MDTPLQRYMEILKTLALQADVDRLDRLNLVGEMAANLSHEIRNPLTTVRGYLQMIRQKGVQYKTQFQTMIDELDRANGIITEFLSLAINRLVELSKQDLNFIIESIRPLMEADAVSQGKSIVVKLRPIGVDGPLGEFARSRFAEPNPLSKSKAQKMGYLSG